MNKKCGIYKIENKNGKVYIGSSTGIPRRWINHKHSLRYNKHTNTYLQNAWNKYGEEAFKFEIIELVSKDNLKEREQYWINYYDSANPEKGYNIEPDAVRNTHSQATRDKISKSNKALHRKYIITPETREKLRISHLGQIIPQSTRDAVRKALTGLKRPYKSRPEREKPREIRVCICGCNRTFEIRKTLPNKYLPGHLQLFRGIQQEERFCVCGCEQKFTCFSNSAQKSIVGHNLNTKHTVKDLVKEI